MRLKRNLESVVNLFNSRCPNGTDQEQKDCKPDSVLGFDTSEDALEQPFAYGLPGLRVWHAIFLGAAAVLACVVLICCCIKFRIPRTKQEIEGDYIRRKILKKFRQRLKAIQNQELDEMDLKRALDKIRAEFKSDTESLAQSEALSVGTLSSGAFGGPNSSTYRRASQIAMDISIEDLRAHSFGWQGRLRLAFLKCCRRSKPSRISQAESKILPIDTTVQPQSSKKGNPIPTVSIIDETRTKPKLKPKPSVKPKPEELQAKRETGGKAKQPIVEPSTSKKKPTEAKSTKQTTDSKEKRSSKAKEKVGKDTDQAKLAGKEAKVLKEEKAKDKALLKEKKEQEKSAKQQSAKEAKEKKKQDKKVSKEKPG